MIPLNNSIYKSFMTLQFIRKKRFAFFKTLQKLKNSQYYTKEKLEEIQTRKLKQLVKYSYDNVPYYHQLFKKNDVHPNDIKSLKDLKKVPILTKKKIQGNMNKMISKKKSRNNLLKNHTGGSTGTPLTFYQCRNYLNYADAGRILAWYIIPGFDYGTRTAMLWAAQRDIRSNQSFLYRLRNYCRGTISMNALKINDEKFEIFIKRLNQFKPFILRGYPSILLSLAKYIDKHQIDIPNISCVITTAEVLHEHQRVELAKVFKCHILNSYGCREVSQIAMECPEHNGLHVLMENQIVELLDSNEDVAPNEIGSVVVTNLNNYGMPFIRYKIEDMAKRSKIDKCNCNRGLSLIDNIIGREEGRIITPSKNYIHFGYFEIKLFGIPGVEEFQIIQNTISDIVILIVGNSDLSRTKLELIRQQMMTEIGENIQIQVKYVNQIKRSETGKYQMLISKVH